MNFGSGTIPIAYSPECVEVPFSEVRANSATRRCRIHYRFISPYSNMYASGNPRRLDEPYDGRIGKQLDAGFRHRDTAGTRRTKQAS
jgi:hypothetical protein